MGATKTFEGYTEEQIKDARKILDVYARMPEEKKPIFTAMMSAFISGMEAQERLNSGAASKA